MRNLLHQEGEREVNGELSFGPTGRRSIGLVAALPPQVGGAITFASWLLVHESALGYRYVTFDLRRPAGGSGGGRLTLHALSLQARNMLRFMPWVARSPRVVHYCVAGNPTGLARDLLFVLLLRCGRRSVIAHVHSGTDLERADHNRLYRLALRLVAACSVETVALSPALAGVFARQGIDAVTIFNPAPLGDVGALADAAADGQGKALRLLFVGRFEERKGCRDLLRAGAGARDLGLDVEVTFVGGEKYSGFEASLRREAEMLGMVEKVAFYGRLTGQALLDQYDSADALCLPSHAEGLPMVVIEAMQRGLPVLATRVGGVPDLVEDGETGFVVEARDTKALKEAIAAAAVDRARLRRMGEAGRHRIATLASDATIVAQWRELYARCVARR